MSKKTLTLIAAAATLALTACVTPGGGQITTGNAATAATGAAGGATSVNANESLERCDAPSVRWLSMMVAAKNGLPALGKPPK